MKLLTLLKESLGLNEGVYDPGILKAFFLAGGPGSGKSFVSGKVTGGQGLKFINSDAYFERLLKKAGMGMDIEKLYGAEDTKIKVDTLRSKAKASAKRTEANYLEGRLGVIFDGTGDDYEKIEGLRQKCIELGYDTYMIFVNTSLDVALQRNQARERTVPINVVKDSWKSVQNNLGKFQNLFGRENIIIVDNNEFKENVLNKVWKQVMKLVKNPVKNPIGKNWIESQLAMKKR
jgi:cytidylate kinase